MYTFFIIVQYIGIVVLFGELCYVFYQKPSRQQMRQNQHLFLTCPMKSELP